MMRMAFMAGVLALTQMQSGQLSELEKDRILEQAADANDKDYTNMLMTDALANGDYVLAAELEEEQTLRNSPPPGWQP